MNLRQSFSNFLTLLKFGETGGGQPTFEGQPLARTLADDGIYVGTIEPVLITYPQWLATRTGYWAWIDISGSITAVTAVVKSAAGTGSATPLTASATRYVTAVVNPANAVGSITALVATVTAPGAITAEIGSAAATGMATALTAAYTRYVAAVVKSAAGSGSAAPVVATVTGPTINVLWSTTDKHAALTLTNAGETIVGADGGWKSARSTVFASTRQRYIEFPLTIPAGIPPFGLGIANSSALLTSYFASNGNGVMWELSTNKIYYNGAVTGDGPGTIANGDRVCMAWDSVTGKVWFAKNSTPDVSGTHHGVLTGSLCSAFGCSVAGSSVTLKDLAVEWLYAPPSGFVEWGAQ